MDWNSNVTLPKFDPAMGTVKAVEIGVDVNLSQQVKIENLGVNNSTVTTTVSSVLSLILPSAEEMNASVSLSISRDLAAFDSLDDFSGESGIDLTESSSSGTVTYNVSEISDFVASTPGENITLKAALDSKPIIDFTGSSSSQVRTKAGARICVSYQYEVAE